MRLSCSRQSTWTRNMKDAREDDEEFELVLQVSMNTYFGA